VALHIGQTGSFPNNARISNNIENSKEEGKSVARKILSLLTGMITHISNLQYYILDIYIQQRGYYANRRSKGGTAKKCG
jgi:hypothetical protein